MKEKIFKFKLFGFDKEKEKKLLKKEYLIIKKKLLFDNGHEIIKKNINKIRKNKIQNFGIKLGKLPKGTYKKPRKGSGISRVSRNKFGRAGISPGTKGGKRAHPPKPIKILKKINLKEKKLSIYFGLFKIFEESKVFLFEDSFFDGVKKLKEFFKIFNSEINKKDIEKIKKNKKYRVGRLKKKIGKYDYIKKYIFITQPKSSIRKIIGNLKGIFFINGNNLNISNLILSLEKIKRKYFFDYSSWIRILNYLRKNFTNEI